MVVPQWKRDNWADRMAAAEHNLSVSADEISKLTNIAEEDLLLWSNSAADREGWPDEDLEDTRTGIRERMAQQRKFTAVVNDVSQDLAMIRDEIEEGGWTW